MPNHKSAEKRARQTERRNEVNRRNRSRMRTALKNLRAAIASGNKEESQTLLPGVISLLDRSVRKGVLHDNAASRQKSRLTKSINVLAAK